MSNTEFINAFRNFFIGREDAYGMYYIDNKNNVQITVKKEAITDDLIERHLNKEITIGSYNAFKKNDIWYCKWICGDFDAHEDVNGIEYNFLPEDVKDDLNVLSLIVMERLMEIYNIDKNVILRVFSGRGFHIFIKLAENTLLYRAYSLGQEIKQFIHDEYGLCEEIFPKQSELEKDGYGNFVKLPLSVNKRNGEFCEILDNFDLLKQGDGYIIPNTVKNITFKSPLAKIKKIKKNATKKKIEFKEESFDWFMENIKPCFKAIALGELKTHNTKSNYGHLMNIALLSSLLYLGADDKIIQKAFSKHEGYDPAKTKKHIDSFRKVFDPKYIENLKCRTIKERGFCIECLKE